MQVMEITDKNEKLLKSFFTANKQEVADNGFSERVLRQLPETSDRSWIVWAFGALGTTVSLLLGFYSGFVGMALAYLQQIPFYYLLAAVFCFPLVSVLAICRQQNCRFRSV